jgi:DNA repair exonuclease SbcCD ATPase subunit
MEPVKSEKERLASLETEVTNVGKTIDRVEMKLDFFNQSFMPRTEIDEKFRSRDQDISEIREMIKDLNDSFQKGIDKVADSFQEQLKETKQDKRNIRRLWPTWVSSIASIGALIISIIALT